MKKFICALIIVITVIIFSGCEVLRLSKDSRKPGMIWVPSNPDLCYTVQDDDDASVDGYLRYKGKVYPVHIGYRSDLMFLSSNDNGNIGKGKYPLIESELKYSNKDEVNLKITENNISGSKFTTITFKRATSLPSWAENAASTGSSSDK